MHCCHYLHNRQYCHNAHCHLRFACLENRTVSRMSSAKVHDIAVVVVVEVGDGGGAGGGVLH